MSKAVLISIQPKWCELIASGRKTLEVRKNRPTLDTPFKCYIYCTKGDPSDAGDDFWLHDLETFRSIKGNGRVIGEFMCEKVVPIKVFKNGTIQNYMFYDLEQTMMHYGDIAKYIGEGRDGCGWHISDLKIYSKPKYLSGFTGLRKTKFGLEPVRIRRAPQSWCYVEEESGGAVFK